MDEDEGHGKCKVRERVRIGSSVRARADSAVGCDTRLGRNTSSGLVPWRSNRVPHLGSLLTAAAQSSSRPRVDKVWVQVRVRD